MAESPVKVLFAGDATAGGIVRSEMDGAGVSLLAAASEEEAINAIQSERLDALITERQTPRLDGLRLMSTAKRLRPELCVIVLGSEADANTAAEAMQLGAHDFLVFPLNASKLPAVLERGLEFQDLMQQRAALRRRLDDAYRPTHLIGASILATSAYETIRRAASHDRPVIITGEKGTGKDFAAQSIHTQSARRDRSFAVLACREYDRDAATLALFGAADSAGTIDTHTGLLESIDGGTLHIRDAAALPGSAHAPLLEYLRKGRAARVGSAESYGADVRLLFSVEPVIGQRAATGRLLDTLQQEFGASVVELPPLRERSEDIPLIIENELSELRTETGKTISGIDPALLDLCMRYNWPGNLRELRDALRIAFDAAKTGENLAFRHFPPILRNALPPSPGEIRIPAGTPLREIERMAIEEAMKTHGGRKEQVAKALGIGLRTLYRKLEQYEGE